LQRKSQRDNLAAVQATAVYHRAAADPTLPVLCLSSTIHPGTEASYLNSITFGDPVSPADPTSPNNVTRYPSLNANYVRPPGTQALFPEADFFTGRGTANMEYGNATSPTQPPFEVADFAEGSVWLKALTNLAQFSGDPNGAFPPSQAPPGGNQVYPDPVLTMWGDYSNLRRTLATMEAGTSYADLSPADQANLHTAACTMGLLATNVHWYLDWGYFGGGNDFYRNGNNGSTPYNGSDDPGTPRQINMKRLADALRKLQDGDPGNYEIGQGVLSFIPTNGSGPARNKYNIPAEYYIAALARIRDQETFSTAPNSEYQKWNRLVYLARMMNTRLQIVRDRTYGFREYVPGAQVTTSKRLDYTFQTDGSGSDPYKKGDTVNLPCDLRLADIKYFGYGSSSPGVFANDSDGRRIEREMVALARLCPTQPKYPSLFYLFPGDLNSKDGIDPDDAHRHDSAANASDSVDPTPYNQPSGSAINSNENFSEPYVLSNYIANTANATANYEAFGLGDLAAMRMARREPSIPEWNLPIVNLLANRPVTDANLYQKETDLIVSVGGTSLSAYRTGLAEKALYDGRQLLTTRVMDFDLDLLRDFNRGYNGDAWLTVGDRPNLRAGGIIYAFREDAKREDALLRPANESWSNYYTSWTSNTADGPPLALRMNADPRTPSDPPVSDRNISGKPVDYYADPDRRAHGFRLMNGNNISRLNVPAAQNIYGLSFISDNPVYIMTQLARGVSGFNIHANAGGAPIEEFTTLLPFPYTFNQFYNRLTRNPAFAIPTGTDTWRPAEILADAITLITHNFCDGYQEHGIRNVDNIDGEFGNECTSGGPSFRNTPVISVAIPDRNQWAREHPYDWGTPIIINRDAAHRTLSGGLTGSTQGNIPVNSYNAVTSRAAVPSRGTDYTVNAVIVSGLVPSRRLQSFGGLHNFPRFLEQGNALRIQGSLIQLAFSNYATAPFDFDSFERNQVGVVAENIPYYGAPQRFWGYDPGLQYAPAGPVAQRFVIPSNARSEYFLETPADDPYTCQLRRFVVPGLTCP
jgi:hypothetical protein